MNKPWLARIAGIDFWRALAGSLGVGGSSRHMRITDRQGLAEFVCTRASHLAQSALYGYLRTRAGARYPELFANDQFLESVNIAKWQMWIACVSDLAVYAGGLVAGQTGANPQAVGELMRGVLGDIFAQMGVPSDAGPDFEAYAQHARDRVASCDWGAVADDATAFSESPSALVQWAPVVDELKALDADIVRNSVRFRWHEVRRDLRRRLDAQSMMSSAPYAPLVELPSERRD